RLGAQLDAGNVAQAQFGTVLRTAHDDVAELFRGLQARLRVDGGVELLALHRRRTTQLADGHLRVLCLHRSDHFRHRHAVGVQLVRVQPDAHGVLATEHLDVAHARNAAETIHDVGTDVVGDVVGI